MKKLSIVLSTIHYPLSMASYIIRAFLRREDVDLWTTGPYTGTWIPWTNIVTGEGNINIDPKYVYQPSFPLPQQAIHQKVPYSIVKNVAPENVDLWLQVDAGWHFSTMPSAGCNALVKTDPHVLDEFYSNSGLTFDKVFSMQLEYLKPTEIYLPYAYDPTVHYPEENDGYEYDACLVGLLYNHRADLINALKKKGLKVYYNIGEVFDDNRKRYNKSKIALSWSSLKDTPARVFEAMGMAIPLVCNRTPDLANFFVDGEHYFGFDTLQEAIGKVEWILSHYDEAIEVAEAAERKVRAKHTWDHRIQTILESCKLV